MKKVIAGILIILTSILTILIISKPFSHSTIKPSSRQNTNQTNSADTNLSLLTFNELTRDVAKNNNIDMKTASKLLGKSLSDEIHTNEEKKFRILSSDVTTNEKQSSTLRYYCEMTDRESFREVENLLFVDIEKNDNGAAKEFHGNIFVNLEDKQTIFTTMNGDFYQKGELASPIKIGAENTFEVAYRIKNPKAHDSYFYSEATINL